MSETTTPVEVTDCLEAVKTAHAEGKITDSAVENLTAWLTQPRYSDFVPGIVDHIQNRMWQELDNVFWTVIPFGTGGRRGMMYPFGSNAINTRTIGESARAWQTTSRKSNRMVPGQWRSPMTPVTEVASSPNSVPASWWPTGSKFTLSTTIAAHRSCRF